MRVLDHVGTLRGNGNAICLWPTNIVGNMEPSLLRAETVRRFSDWGLIPNEGLPLVEGWADLTPKLADQVATRTVAASYVASRCFGAPLERVKAEVERFGLWSHLTEEEKKLFTQDGLTTQAQAYHSWIIESIQFMAWAMNLAKLNHLEPCDERLADLLPRGTDPTDFINSARLRPRDEIKQESDTLYMLHWRAVESNIDQSSNDLVVLPRVSFRRHASDWIIGTADNWDDVAMDT